jgi:hypothetical protein
MTAVAKSENRFREEKSVLLRMSRDKSLSPQQRLEAIDRLIWVKLSEESRKDYNAFRARRPSVAPEVAAEAVMNAKEEKAVMEPVPVLPSYL